MSGTGLLWFKAKAEPRAINTYTQGETSTQASQATKQTQTDLYPHSVGTTWIVIGGQSLWRALCTTSHLSAADVQVSVFNRLLCTRGPGSRARGGGRGSLREGTEGSPRASLTTPRLSGLSSQDALGCAKDPQNHTVHSMTVVQCGREEQWRQVVTITEY